jgi:hypothetical protein
LPTPVANSDVMDGNQHRIYTVGAQHAAPLQIHRQGTPFPHFIIVVLALLLCGCALAPAQVTARVALLAPFEGRYREIGYNALYAGRLAFTDADHSNLELFAADDGGTPQRASERARALALDPTIVAVVVLGYHAAAPDTLAALEDIPSFIVGNWSEPPQSSTVYLLSNPALNDQITTSPYPAVTEAAAVSAPVVGGEVFALEGFAHLRGSLAGVTLVSSGSLPDEEFAQRCRASDPFAPEPGLLATLTYDAFRIVLEANRTDRASMNDSIRSTTYVGLNGAFTLTQQRWQQAPIHFYRFEDGRLTAADHVIEQRQRIDGQFAKAKSAV